MSLAYAYCIWMNQNQANFCVTLSSSDLKAGIKQLSKLHWNFQPWKQPSLAIFGKLVPLLAIFFVLVPFLWRFCIIESFRNHFYGENCLWFHTKFFDELHSFLYTCFTQAEELWRLFKCEHFVLQSWPHRWRYPHHWSELSSSQRPLHSYLDTELCLLSSVSTLSVQIKCDWSSPDKSQSANVLEMFVVACTWATQLSDKGQEPTIPVQLLTSGNFSKKRG